MTAGSPRARVRVNVLRPLAYGPDMDLSAARRVVVGVPLSLSGRYGFMGRLAAAGLEQAIDDSRTAGGVMVAGQRRWPELVILDDMSQRRRVRPCLDALARADLLVGPYGSDLMDEAAAWAAG